jgi:ISXO2-like transposase domain
MPLPGKRLVHTRAVASLIAGTIFGSTKVRLRVWFRAMYHLTQSKGGISSLELGRRLGVTQNTAWKLKHKLKQVMLERDAGKRLIGRVEIDDAYLGGERSGGKRGRGAPGKTPIIVAMETTPEGQPVRLHLRRVSGFRLTPAFSWVNTALGNIKTAITGTYRAIRQKHVPRYLAEFAYRFNRRYDLAAMMPRLGWAAVRTPSMPYDLLKLAEAHA